MSRDSRLHRDNFFSCVDAGWFKLKGIHVACTVSRNDI